MRRNALRQRSPCGFPHRDVTSQTRTPTTPGARCHSRLDPEIPVGGGSLGQASGAAFETPLRDSLVAAQYGHGYPTQRRDRRRRHRRPVRGQRAARARAASCRLRAGHGDRRDRRRRLRHAERGTTPREHRARRRGRALGRPCRPGIRVFPPRRRSDRASSGDRRRGVECLFWHAPRRLHRVSRCASARRHHPHRSPRGRLRADRGDRPREVRQRHRRRGRRGDRRRRHPLRAAAPRLPALEAALPRHDLVPWPGAARAPAGLANGSLADVGGALEALPRLPGAPWRDGQLRRFRADRREDEGVVVRTRRPGGAAPRVPRAGIRASGRC